MAPVKSILLFAVAAVLEIGGARLVWQGAREHVAQPRSLGPAFSEYRNPW